MVSVEPISDDPPDPDPINVVDRQLWRDAQVIVNQHVATAEGETCRACGQTWPCIMRRNGERAQVAAFKPWNEVWTARHDLQSATAFWRWNGQRPSATRNRGVFV